MPRRESKGVCLGRQDLVDEWLLTTLRLSTTSCIDLCASEHMGYDFPKRGVQGMQWHTFVYYKYISSPLLHSIRVSYFKASTPMESLQSWELATLAVRSHVGYEMK